MRIVSVNLDEKMLEELDRYAIEHNMTRSDVIRKAIELLLKTDLLPALKSEGSLNFKSEASLNIVKENDLP